MGAALSQGADSKLEGTAGHVYVIVLHTDGVHARLRGNEADAVGVVFALHDVGFVNLTSRAGHLSRHVRYADFCASVKFINETGSPVNSSEKVQTNRFPQTHQ